MTDPSPATVERVAIAMRDEFARIDRGGLGREDWRSMARAAIAAMEEAAPVDESEAALWDEIRKHTMLGSFASRSLEADVEALIAHRGVTHT